MQPDQRTVGPRRPTPNSLRGRIQRHFKSFATVLIIAYVGVLFWRLHLLNILGPIRNCIPLSDHPVSDVDIAILSFHHVNISHQTTLLHSKHTTTDQSTKMNLSAYAKRHKYSLVVEDDISVNEDLEKFAVVWAKVDMIIKYLAYYDWIVWVDSDVLIMNFDIRLETFLDATKGVVITKDPRGFNAGTFFLRNTEAIHAMLKIWKSGASKYVDEQAVLASILHNNPNVSNITRILPQCSFNSYIINQRFMTRYEYGDFAVHFAGSNWILVDDMRVLYSWNLITFWSELIGDSGMTLLKWLSWENVSKVLSIPWNP